MARTSDSYPSVIRGVSEQVPHDRLPGQHWEQENMISDPVRGLSRRHGSINLARSTIANAITAADRADAAGRGEHTVTIEGTEYSLLVRQTTMSGSQLNPIIAVNKRTKAFVPVISTDAQTSTLLQGGISSVTAAGQFLIMAAASARTDYVALDNMPPTRAAHVVWVRGGANSRTYTVTSTSGSSVVPFTYTTMSAYYEGRLDTSDIPINLPGGTTPDPEYGKKVNDRVNAYNTAVNQHIAAVAKDIAPENIAWRLAEKLKVVFAGTFASGPYIYIPVDNTVISADDGGNGDLMRACSQEVTSPELLTPKHLIGKVVRIVPRTSGAIPYYMIATTTGNNSGFADVVWKECPGTRIIPGFVTFIGAIVGGSLYVSRLPSLLASSTGLPVPGWSESSSGDSTSQPIPEFFGKIVTHVRMFQDRLMLVSGSTVFLSRSGDYFNFFRKSALTVADDDPIEVYAQGTEDDTITGGVQHDRNVILCGGRYQYIVPGRENMTPRNPYVGVQATYEGANLVNHSVAGSLLFFCQRREKRLTLQRMQPGAVADQLDAVDVSSQLDGYLTGTPRQIVSMTAPGVVFLRTKEFTNGFFVYSWLDSSSDERLFDSWSKWSFDKSLGEMVGMTDDDSGLLVVTIRTTSAGPRLMLDRFTRETAPSDMPYLDSMVKHGSSLLSASSSYAAFDAQSQQFLVGLPATRANELATQFPADVGHLWHGTNYPAYATLTSPYIRDREDKIILEARLTVSKLSISVSNSAAMLADVSYDMGKSWKTVRSWSYREAGAWVLNEQSIAEEYTVTVPILKENKTYRARLSARSWLPMTVASIEWAGQAFTSRR